MGGLAGIPLHSDLGDVGDTKDFIPGTTIPDIN